ncbi:MAG: acyloxyacyl hydrolase [Bacteroidales bacterium]|jgi:hypothetical protein
MRLIFSVIFLLFSVLSFAQERLFIELKPFAGRVAPHRIGMESLAKGHSFGTELNFLRQNFSENVFSKKYNFPKTGFGLSFQSLGNPEDLGNVYAAYLLTEYDINKIFGIKVYSGLAFLTKKYDKIENPQNIAIGTNLNYYFNLGICFKQHIGNDIIALAPGLIHFSNGSIRMPNLGLNQVYLSLSYQFNVAERNKIKKVYLPENVSKSEFWVMATAINSDEYTIRPESRGGGFLCSTVAIGYNYAYSFTGKFGCSVDAFYNSNFQYYWDTNWDVLTLFYPDFKDVVRYGMSFGHQFVYSRFEMLTYAGFYLYNNRIKSNEFAYTRVGVRYYLTDFLFLNLTLKAFGFKAEYIESGIGFSYRKKQKENSRDYSLNSL